MGCHQCLSCAGCVFSPINVNALKFHSEVCAIRIKWENVKRPTVSRTHCWKASKMSTVTSTIDKKVSCLPCELIRLFHCNHDLCNDQFFTCSLRMRYYCAIWDERFKMCNLHHNSTKGNVYFLCQHDCEASAKQATSRSKVSVHKQLITVLQGTDALCLHSIWWTIFILLAVKAQ